MDWKLGLLVVHVSDVDHAKDVYASKLDFEVDHDAKVGDDLRVVQLTPPGSACSIAIGTGIAEMPAASLQGLQLVVPDVGAARAELVERGVEVGEVQALAEGERVDAAPPYDDWNAFVFFRDPDGNGWAVHQGPARG
jgi:catechol 2,3-dioxygenase-like lactoylglutathione lyase family enzyme